MRLWSQKLDINTVTLLYLCYRNSGGFERRSPSSDDLEEEDDQNDQNEESFVAGSGSAGSHFEDPELDENPPEWEMGIRRSAKAKVMDIC